VIKENSLPILGGYAPRRYQHENVAYCLDTIREDCLQIKPFQDFKGNRSETETMYLENSLDSPSRLIRQRTGQGSYDICGYTIACLYSEFLEETI